MDHPPPHTATKLYQKKSLKLYLPNNLFSALLKLAYSPSVIFSIQKEISAHNGDAHSYNGENDKHKQHKTKHIVYLVCPEWCEDKVPNNKKSCKD